MSSKEEVKSALEVLSEHADDRVSRYERKQWEMTPSRYFREVRMYWAIGTILRFAAFFVMVWAGSITLQKNADAQLNFVRVDGVKVQEARDERRDILMRNTLEKSRLKRQMAQQSNQKSETK